MQFAAMLDALVFSSVWVGAAAALLCAAAGLAMGHAAPVEAIGVAGFGTLAIYNIDRLRDLLRDHETAPARSQFVKTHRNTLIALAAVGALVAIGLGLHLGWASAALLAPVLALGLFHRRLKTLPWVKPAYVALGWVSVTVGLPALAMAEPLEVEWVAAILAAALIANAIASNVRDGEGSLAANAPSLALRAAIGTALLGVLVALLSPAATRNLLWIPLLTGLSLLRFRSDERYGLQVVDGALGLGAIVSIALML